MSTIISSTKKYYIEDIIRTLCASINNSVSKDTSWTEYSLRRELVACILGSQVRHEMATKALERLENAELLSDKRWNNADTGFEFEVYETLSNRAPSSHESWCYRFPKIRAKQLAKTRDEIVGKSLYEMLFSSTEPKLLRKHLVNEISGIGPKQASMLIRNVGVSYNLAVLDTHVLNFLEMQNIVQRKQLKINTFTAYEQVESIVQNYSESLGYPVGYLDWAIWATMKAVRGIS